MFHADGQTGMNVIVALRNFANAPKNLVLKNYIFLMVLNSKCFSK